MFGNLSFWEYFQFFFSAPSRRTCSDATSRQIHLRPDCDIWFVTQLIESLVTQEAIFEMQNRADRSFPVYRHDLAHVCRGRAKYTLPADDVAESRSRDCLSRNFQAPRPLACQIGAGNGAFDPNSDTSGKTTSKSFSCQGYHLRKLLFEDKVLDANRIHSFCEDWLV